MSFAPSINSDRNYKSFEVPLLFLFVCFHSFFTIVTSLLHPDRISSLTSHRALLVLNQLYSLTFLEILILFLLDKMAPFNLNTTMATNLTDLLRFNHQNQMKEVMWCHKARFMEHLSRPQVEGTYWTMTIVLIFLAMAAGVIYSRANREYR
jgi:hypothetical protein